MKREPVCNEVVYRLKNIYSCYKVLVLYEESLARDSIGKLLVDYMKNNEWDYPKVVNDEKNSIDCVFDSLYGVFPIPFCA